MMFKYNNNIKIRKVMKLINIPLEDKKIRMYIIIIYQIIRRSY